MKHFLGKHKSTIIIILLLLNLAFTSLSFSSLKGKVSNIEREFYSTGDFGFRKFREESLIDKLNKIKSIVEINRSRLNDIRR